MQASRQLFAESHASRTEVVQSDLNPTQLLKGEGQVLQKQQKHEHGKTPLVGNEGIKSLEPNKNKNVKKSDTFYALMTSKRPLCAQEKERADQEEPWSQVGEIGLASADEITGPSAYTRRNGARYLIQMEKELTRNLWKK
ncbi:hypothetical protein LSM04_002551 [Trypanosoma melophagium]|uniref:uncharacterized protein n=1 Tax=Trypanosoma melophagium TaxID=715481 RepID=UPI00351A2B57|nr:hypothetical protein LSM04_002551 [Trypanosoma melophagium]